MTDEQYHEATITAASNARKSITVLLHHLIEVEKRRIYAKKGTSSLFDYCVRYLKMSEPQAARHVNAAREVRDFPELAEKVDAGAICFTTVSQVHTALKNESKEAKREMFRKLEHKSTREVEKLLKKDPPKLKISDPELMADLERLKELWGLADMTEVLKRMGVRGSLL